MSKFFEDFEQQQRKARDRANKLSFELREMLHADGTLKGLVIGPVGLYSACFPVTFPNNKIRLSVSCSVEYAHETVPIGPDDELIYGQFGYDDDVWFLDQTVAAVYDEILRMHMVLSQTDCSTVVTGDKVEDTGVTGDKVEDTGDTGDKVEDTSVTGVTGDKVEVTGVKVEDTR